MVLAASFPVSGSATYAGSQGQRVRAISSPSPLPIPERLLDDDDIVVVSSLEDPAVLPTTNRIPMTVLRQAVATEFGTTAVIDVSKVEPALSEDGQWVHTRFSGVVREVLRLGPKVPPDERLVAGQVVEFRFGGGEISIKGVTVRAGQVVPFPAGQYLVLLAHKSGPTWWTLSDQPPLVLRNGSLAAVPPSTSQLAGLKMSDVRDAVRRANRVR